MTSTVKNICVLGAGTWGWAVAHYLSNNKNNSVRIWTPTGKNLPHFLSLRTHPKLPDEKLVDSVLITDNLSRATEGADVLVMAVSSPYVRQISGLLMNQFGNRALRIISLVKGLEASTALTMSQIMREVLPNADVCVLSGGSHAEEVIKGLPFALTAASSDLSFAEEVAQLFRQSNVGIKVSDDISGLEISAALKNIISIASGIADGQHLGDNFRSALITRGLHAIKELGVVCGAAPETFYEDCCLGDLLATAFSNHSRNRRFGLLIGEGFSKAEALNRVGMAVEGLNALQGALTLAEQQGLRIGFAEAIRDIVEGRKSPSEIVPLVLQD